LPAALNCRRPPAVQRIVIECEHYGERTKTGIAMNPSFADSELAVIDRVCEAAWAQVEARDPQRDKAKDNERRAALRKRVLNSACAGQVEFDSLYRMVLATIPHKWSDNGSSP
jgi:predicted metal-dependent HD superfamily phosphohydrolase